VTHRTVGELCSVSDVVLLYQLLPQRELVSRRLPARIEYLVARPHEPLGLAMALEAPFHVQRIFRPHHRHLIDRPMTGRAANAFFHVDAVIEIDKIGQVMNPCPRDRLVGSPACPDGFQHGTGDVNLGVTGHTSLGGRDAGKTALFH